MTESAHPPSRQADAGARPGVPANATNNATTGGPPAGRGAGALLRGTAAVAIGLAIAQGLGYALNLVGARVLGPDTFGAFGALMSLLLIGNVVALGIQAVAARRLVLLPDDERHGASATVLRQSAAAALAVGLVTALTAPLVSSLLHLPGIWATALVALTLVPLTFAGAEFGVAQGYEANLRLGVVYAVIALGKAGGGIVAALAGGTLASTLTGMAIGSWIAAAVALLALRGLHAQPARALPGAVAELAHATHALLALFVLTNIDVALARHFLPAGEAGEYAVGAIVSKVTFWLPMFIIVVAFPRMADARRGTTTVRAAGLVALIGVAVTAGVALLPGLVVAIVGGKDYAGLDASVWLFAAAGAGFALAQFLLYSRLAVADRRVVAALWVAAAALIGGVLIFHESLTEIITVVTVVSLALSAVGLLAMRLDGTPDADELALVEAETGAI